MNDLISPLLNALKLKYYKFQFKLETNGTVTLIVGYEDGMRTLCLDFSANEVIIWSYQRNNVPYDLSVCDVPGTITFLCSFQNFNLEVPGFDLLQEIIDSFELFKGTYFHGTTEKASIIN